MKWTVNLNYLLTSENEDIQCAVKQSKPSDAGPSNLPSVLSSDSSEEINKNKQLRIRRILSSSDDDSEFPSRELLPIINTSPLSPRLWKKVTLNDKYHPDKKNSTGQNSVGPQVPLTCTTPLDYFKLFFTEDIETNKYAANIKAMKNLSTFSIWTTWYPMTEVEMKALLGVIIKMAFIEVSDMKEYWSLGLAFYKKIPFL